MMRAMVVSLTAYGNSAGTSQNETAGSNPETVLEETATQMTKESENKEVESGGWLNGDIAIGMGVPWFTVLFASGEISERFEKPVNTGVIDCKLSAISDLAGSCDVLIELV